ncbi:MAG: thioesterase family protein [Pseudomonadota bacterium]
MAKPDPALLDAARYPYRLEIPTRFGDLDMNQHVNNVAMAGLFEDARVRFLHHVGLMGPESQVQPMAASFAIDYLRQAYYPQPLTFCVAVSQIGNTSHTLINLALQDDRPVALAHSVVVITAGGRPCPLPQGIDSVLRSLALRG